MKRVILFLCVLMLIVGLNMSCGHQNQPEISSNVDSTTVVPRDSNFTDTISSDTIISDTIISDTVINDSTPIDIPFTDTILYSLQLSVFDGTIYVDETGFVQPSTAVELRMSDSIAGKYRMILYQVSFDPQMPLMDIALDGVSADAQGNVWCDSIAPLWLNVFGSGFDMPQPNYMVKKMRGKTWFNTVLEQAFYSTELDIANVGVARYEGVSIEE